MAKHIVICDKCGRQFDESIESAHYNPKTRRYTCMDCVHKQNSARPAKKGMGGMIAKIAVGVIFIISAFMTGTLGAALVGIILGLALVAWGLLPWLLPRINEKKAAATAEAARIAEEERKANEPKVCPACGARTKGTVCEYCGEPLK